jgi:hypothetical protein
MNDTIINCYVEEKKISLSDIGVRTFNFGQHWRSKDIVEGLFSLDIPIFNVHDYLHTQYSSLIQFCYDEKRVRKDPNDVTDIEREFEKQGYPENYDQIRARPNEFQQLIYLIVDWLQVEILGHFVGDKNNPGKIPTYAINSISAFRIESEKVSFAGVCRNGIPENFRIQDA